jgi:peptide/nickel transport system permease protein
VNAQAADWVRQELGLDQSGWRMYGQWLWDLLQFNLGHSLVSGDAVSAIVWHQLGHSLLLAVVALTLSVVIALPIGLLCATRGPWFDNGVLMLSTLIKALPVFVIGLVLILLFSLHWQWLPAAGFGQWQHLILPAFTLAISLAAISNRVVKASAASVFQSAFYQFAYIKGLNRWQTFTRHGVRNIAVPVVAFIGIQFVGVIEGIVMIESLFSWPGIGHGLAHAIFARDIPVIQGAALMMGFLFVGLNTLVDLTCFAIDPRSTSHEKVGEL